MLVVMSLLALSACGDDERIDKGDEVDRNKIAACVNDNGNAVFTSDQYGEVEFIVCDYP